MAVCLQPGTELLFASEIRCLPAGLAIWSDSAINFRTATFRKLNTDKPTVHHDALEFPDGRTVLLKFLCERQQATVLELPIVAKIDLRSKARQKMACVE
jgi:hypothetical protein